MGYGLKERIAEKVALLDEKLGLQGVEPIMEPPIRFKNNAEKYGFKKDDVLVFKIGQITKLKEIINK